MDSPTASVHVHTLLSSVTLSCTLVYFMIGSEPHALVYCVIVSCAATVCLAGFLA